MNREIMIPLLPPPPPQEVPVQYHISNILILQGMEVQTYPIISQKLRVNKIKNVTWPKLEKKIYRDFMEKWSLKVSDFLHEGRRQ